MMPVSMCGVSQKRAGTEDMNNCLPEGCFFKSKFILSDNAGSLERNKSVHLATNVQFVLCAVREYAGACTLAGGHLVFAAHVAAAGTKSTCHASSLVIRNTSGLAGIGLTFVG